MGKTRELRIDVPTIEYYSGQTIQGKVRYEAKEDFEASVVKIVLKGHAMVAWSEGDALNATIYTNSEKCIDNEIILQQGRPSEDANHPDYVTNKNLPGYEHRNVNERTLSRYQRASKRKHERIENDSFDDTQHVDLEAQDAARCLLDLSSSEIPILSQNQGGSGQDTVTVHRGPHELPFSFQLPPHLPSTFTINQGMVGYELTAIIDRPWSLNEFVTLELKIMSVLDLNLNPESLRPADFEDEKTVCCLCCATGPITANLHIDRTGYVPGETITVRGSCENRSTRKCSVQLRIKVHTVCIGKACCRIKKKIFDEEVFRHNLPNIEPRGRQQIDGERFVLPALPPTGLENCSIMTNSYTLDYTIDPGLSSNLKVPVPLIVGSIPLKAFTSPPSDNTTLYPQVANSALTTNMASFSTAGHQTSEHTESSKPQYGFYDWNKHESI